MRAPTLLILLAAATSCAKPKHFDAIIGPTTESLRLGVHDEVRVSDDARQKSLEEEFAKLTSPKFQKAIADGRKEVDSKALFARIPDGADYQPKFQRVQTLVEQCAALARDKKLDEMGDAAAEGFDVAVAQATELDAKGNKAAAQAKAAYWDEAFQSGDAFLDRERVYIALSQLADVLRDIHADTLDVLSRYAPKNARMKAFTHAADERKKLGKPTALGLAVANARLEVALVWGYRREIDPDNEAAMRSRLLDLGLDAQVSGPAPSAGSMDGGVE